MSPSPNHPSRGLLAGYAQVYMHGARVDTLFAFLLLTYFCQANLQGPTWRAYERQRLFSFPALFPTDPSPHTPYSPGTV